MQNVRLQNATDAQEKGIYEKFWDSWKVLGSACPAM